MERAEPVDSAGGGLTMSEEGGLEEVDESFCAAASFSSSCRTLARKTFRSSACSASCRSNCLHRGHNFLARLSMILHDRNGQSQRHYYREGLRLWHLRRR